MPFILHGYVYAADYDRLVTCSTNTCTISSDDPLFQERNWAPGARVTKTIRIKNTKSTPLLVYTSADKTVSSSDLGDVIGMKITEEYNHIIYLDTTLTHFFDQRVIGLGKINGNSQEDYIFYASLQKDTGNTYQNKQTTFSLSFNFSCTPLNSPTPTPTRRPSPTLTPKPTHTPTPTPKQNPPHPPRYDFRWFTDFLERLRRFYR